MRLPYNRDDQLVARNPFPFPMPKNRCRADAPPAPLLASDIRIEIPIQSELRTAGGKRSAAFQRRMTCVKFALTLARAGAFNPLLGKMRL